MGSFAVLAFVLSISGLYALVSYNVRSRIREWGIRMAIGARPADLLMLVHVQTMRIAAVGILAGVLVALAASRLLGGFLFGVPPRDLLSYGAAVLLLGLAAAVASYRPARMATRTDPVGALKTD
jgi:ABC-type antimicrobial peptide transport system permease subunit